MSSEGSLRLCGSVSCCQDCCAGTVGDNELDVPIDEEICASSGCQGEFPSIVTSCTQLLLGSPIRSCLLGESFKDDTVLSVGFEIEEGEDFAACCFTDDSGQGFLKRDDECVTAAPTAITETPSSSPIALTESPTVEAIEVENDENENRNDDERFLSTLGFIGILGILLILFMVTVARYLSALKRNKENTIKVIEAVDVDAFGKQAFL